MEMVPLKLFDNNIFLYMYIFLTVIFLMLIILVRRIKKAMSIMLIFSLIATLLNPSIVVNYQFI